MVRACGVRHNLQDEARYAGLAQATDVPVADSVCDMDACHEATPRQAYMGKGARQQYLCQPAWRKIVFDIHPIRIQKNLSAH
jgi:hypothetical protein